jgi:hypothetical protein
MTQKFWDYSIFEETENTTLCHGTAANLYSKDDFRMLMCGKISMDDFYVIHHEMGHIQYYMAYQEQPVVFQVIQNNSLCLSDCERPFPGRYHHRLPREYRRRRDARSDDTTTPPSSQSAKRQRTPRQQHRTLLVVPPSVVKNSGNSLLSDHRQVPVGHI